MSFMKSLTPSDFYLAPDLRKFEVPYEVSRNTAVKYHALGKVYVFDAATYQKIDFLLFFLYKIVIKITVMYQGVIA